MKEAVFLCTGGTGSLGQKLVKRLLALNPKKVIIFSRDEFKQHQMAQSFNNDRLRFFLGDVRDKDRLYRALNGTDYVIHTAALKQVPALEYNPTEAVKTNVLGAMNLIDACIDNGVKKLINISTDKAVNPVNLYGATKLCAEKLFTAANSFAHTRFCSVRYGNVIGSRGGIIPYWLELKKRGTREFSVTHAEMTRFWITLDEAVDLIFYALECSDGEKIIVPEIPSMKIVDMAKAISPDCVINFTGIRPGEKMHETLIAKDEKNIVLLSGGVKYIVEEFRSDINSLWMTKRQFLEKLKSF